MIRAKVPSPSAAVPPLWYTAAGLADVKRWPAAMSATWHTADWWFSALDEKTVTVGADSITVQVVGIHGDGPSYWIQVESSDRVRKGVLRVFSGTRLADALAALGVILLTGR